MSTNAGWDGSASNYSTAADYCDACLINENTGPRSGWTKDKCHLPVKTPGSSKPDRKGLVAAAQRLSQTKASPSAKAGAKRALRRMYKAMSMTLPDSLK